MRATVERPGLDSQGRSSLVKIRRVRPGDVPKVQDIIEQAFGDFFERQFGTRPRQVFGGAQYVHHRWLMEPWGCFVAEETSGKLVGAAVSVLWGGLGLVGPVAVLPNHQNQGVGQQLVAACQAFFDENKVTLQGLVTYPQSPRHLAFYQKFGYRPRGLVAITARSLDRGEGAAGPRPAKPPLGIRRFSSLEEARKKTVLLKLRRISNGIRRGMDLRKEVEIADGLALGDTLLLERGSEVIGFAIFHTPGRGEAPHGSLYLKFLAIDPRHRKPEHVQTLLGALEDVAIDAQLPRLIAPVYTYYWTAYQTLLQRGYAIDFVMVRMRRGKPVEDENPSDLVLDDWR
jgi:ribosomal protein S18 acetylase RimI-like enzyme